MHASTTRARTLALLAAMLAGAAAPRGAQGGCGCDKPPPPPAQVRPAVAYAGAPVALFSSAFQVGAAYTVTFTSGITGDTASVDATVVSLRDLADGQYKPQLVLPLPVMPLGPASISVSRVGRHAVDLAIDDSAFTVAPTPIALPSQYGSWHYPNFQAAVGRDGVTYIALDATAITLPMVFEARAAGYPLRFDAGDVVFRNVQGFLMQMLMQGAPDATQPVPGMFVFPAANPDADSDVLHYSRHEFTTYFLQHVERQPHAVDPTDGNWHLDGSRHVDHNHLILAIMGTVNGAAPAAGATPPFDLAVDTYSLFYQGLVGTSSMSIGQSSRTDGWDPTTGLFSARGDVFTNGPLTLSGSASVNGSATATSFTLLNSSKITGQSTLLAAPTSFMEIKVPAGIADLGAVSLNGQTMTINGPGSFRVSDMYLSGLSKLYIDNSRGPVTLYLTGSLNVSGKAKIVAADPDPERFALYVAGTGMVSLGGSAPMYGVLYAPTSSVAIGGSAQFFGAFVGQDLSMTGSARVHYDQALRGQ
jgi:hypothetical protein